MKPCRAARPWLSSTGVLFVLTCVTSSLHAQASIDVAKMPRVGAVDERFQSYNIEMVEVVGGRFWKPYRSETMDTKKSNSETAPANTPAGMDPNLFQYRPPINLANVRLRKMAAALGPAYVRVSGTWANSVYFQNSDGPSMDKAPAGFSGVLTRKEWSGVIDFSHAADAEIVTSVATSPGTRDAKGTWTPEQAGQLFAYTKSLGGQIAATEFMNEPTYAAMGGAPKNYDAAAYGRDIAVFRPFLKQTFPNTIFLGPGSVGEGPFAMPMGSGVLNSADLMKATGPVFDVFSYHLYAAASQRCASLGAGSQTTESAALSEEWLSRPGKIDAFYASLRDTFEPGTDLWITETADAACGGNPWASTYLDTFRYLVQHGTVAQRGVTVIMHNTLASSDYGLLDENTFEPRPNYWAALLWRNLMGTTVLDPPLVRTSNVYVYAHCLRKNPGGVALLIINADQQREYRANLPVDSERYTLSARKLEDKTVELNGKALHLQSNDDLPQLTSQPTHAGPVSFAPTSITFLAAPNAGNSSCR